MNACRSPYAHIVGIGTNNDGFTEKGITFPSGEAQRELGTSVGKPAPAAAVPIIPPRHMMKPSHAATTESNALRSKFEDAEKSLTRTDLSVGGLELKMKADHAPLDAALSRS